MTQTPGFAPLVTVAIPSFSHGRFLNDALTPVFRQGLWTSPFSARRRAVRKTISQPAILVRRTAWEKVGGLDESLHMAMDYDMWWLAWPVSVWLRALLFPQSS